MCVGWCDSGGLSEAGEGEEVSLLSEVTAGRLIPAVFVLEDNRRNGGKRENRICICEGVLFIVQLLWTIVIIAL